MYENRKRVRGDNLEEMRKFPDACIDLIATDPPFNSHHNYFVPYRDRIYRPPFLNNADGNRGRVICVN